MRQKAAKFIAALITFLHLRDFFSLVEWEITKKERLEIAQSFGVEGEELTRFMRSPYIEGKAA